MINNKKLKELSDLTEQVVNLSESINKKKGLENLIKKTYLLAPTIIDATQKDFDNIDFMNFEEYQRETIQNNLKINEYIRNIDDFIEYEKDTPEQQVHRKEESNIYRQFLLPKEKVVKIKQYSGARNYVEEIKELDPNWKYSQHGSYTTYIGLKSSLFFPIFLYIAHNQSDVNFETTCQSVMLYIALNNELSNTINMIDVLEITDNTDSIDQSKEYVEHDDNYPESYILDIKNGTITKWSNNKVGQFKDFENNCFYRFRETSSNGNKWLQNENEQRNSRVFACGFVGFIIKNWGKDTQKIFEDYKSIRLNQYKAKHKKAPDAHKRDLEKEFFDQYKEQEEKWIKQSEAIFEFIQTSEADLIREYISNYYDYISRFIKLPYKVYKTFDEAIVDCSLDDRIFLHAYRKFCNPCNKPAFEILNDILMIRSMHNTEPQKCFEYIKKNYNSSWKEYYIIMYMLKTTLDQSSNFQIFIPPKIENTHPLIGFNKHLSETQKLLTDNSNSIGSTKEAINETTSNDPVEILKTVLMIKDDETVLKIYELMNNTLTNSNSKNFDLALFTCAFIEKEFLNSTFNKTNYHSMMKKSLGKKAGSRAKFNEKFNEINSDLYTEELKKCIQKLP